MGTLHTKDASDGFSYMVNNINSAEFVTLFKYWRKSCVLTSFLR